MSKDILVVGKGFMGERIAEAWGCSLSDRRILTLSDAEEELGVFSPRVLINCIGFTGYKNVDDCEQEKDKTLSSNVFVPLMLAEAAIRRGIKFVHISSGCIYHYDYQKSTPITEDQEPDFFDLYYSRSKIYAERALLPLTKRYDVVIPRIRIPLDNRPHPKNILNKLIKYRKVIDVPNSVTYVPDFMAALRYLIDNDARGIFNVVNTGGMCYPRLMDIYRSFHQDFQYSVVDYKSLNLVRTNLIMSTQKMREIGYPMRPIDRILNECVVEYVNREGV